MLYTFGIVALALAAIAVEHYVLKPLTLHTMTQDWALALKMSPAGLDDALSTPVVTDYLRDRYSSDLGRNRLADLLWWIPSVLAVVWCCATAYVVFTLAFTPADQRLLIGITGVGYSVIGWVVLMNALRLLCRLTIGRFPGEPRLVRRRLLKAFR